MDDAYSLAKSILQAPAGGFESLSLYGGTLCGEGTREDSCARFHLENESGTGDIAVYRAFPGIDLIYNDMHMLCCNKNQAPMPHVMEINYCAQGRCECLFSGQRYCYMGAGDLSFCSLHDRPHLSEFPTAYYRGITVTVDFSAVTKEMQSVLRLLNIDLDRIERLSRRRDFTLMRADQAVEHVFSELYRVPEAVRHGYIRVKVLELLLILTGLEPGESAAGPALFTASQIGTIKQIHDLLISSVSERMTIDELAARFGMSPTLMKKCFRAVYGDSIYSYVKRYRLSLAERMLRESSLSVTEIASRIGYLNPNKFTSAFGAEYGMPPTAYRKKV